MQTFRAAVPAVVLAAVFGSGCAINLSAEQWVGKEDKSFAVTGSPELTLKTFDGSIQVTTWDKPVVEVTIERRAGSQAEAEALKVDTSQDGNRIVVEAVQPERAVQVGFHVGRSVRFIVSVPKQTNLVARSGDGSISVTGVKGRLELRTGDGSVTGTGLDGEVVANTGDGSVTLEGVNGAVDVNTGDVSLDHLTFGATDRPYVDLNGSSFTVSHCVFPTGTDYIPLVIGNNGIKAGGRGIFLRNYFGKALSTSGDYNDVVDFTGGNRPAPLVQFI